MTLVRRVVMVAFVVFGCSIPLLAAEGEHPVSWWLGSEQPPDDYGIEDRNLTFVSAEEFNCGAAVFCEWTDHSWGFWYNNGTLHQEALAPLRLPTGALLTGLTVIYRDDSDSEGLVVRVDRAFITPDMLPGQDILVWWASPDGAPGYTAAYVDVDPDHTIVTLSPTWELGSYIVRAELAPTIDVRLRAVVAHWYRQVSPAPASATFSDVPVGHWAFQYVEALAASGITAGCGGGDFCPEEPLTRAQMAVFLAKALGLHWQP